MISDLISRTTMAVPGSVEDYLTNPDANYEGYWDVPVQLRQSVLVMDDPTPYRTLGDLLIALALHPKCPTCKETI